MKRICIFLEHINGIPTSNSEKVLFLAQTLKEKYGFEIITIIFDQNPEKFISYLKCTQIKKIYYVKAETFRAFLFSANELRNMANFLKIINPDVIWGTNSNLYRTLFPKIAYLLRTGLCAACSNFNFDVVSGQITMIRMVYANILHAEIDVFRSKPLMATILDDNNVYTLKKSLSHTNIYNITNQIIELVNKNTIIKRKVKSNLAQSINFKIVIGLGNGIRSKSDLLLFNKLAKVLNNATICGSRELVNRQIIPQKCQIGLTGLQIKADMYIAFGISGSFQHLQGIRHVKKIIAINNDPYATIFQYSDYGIVGDLYEVAEFMINYLGGKNN